MTVTSSKWENIEATLDKWIEVKDATGRLKIATATRKRY